MGNRKAFETKRGGSRVIDADGNEVKQDDVKKKAKKKTSKKTSTNKEG